MTTAPRWNRVSRSNPCPVCGRPDWCLTAPDGTAVICPRTESSKRVGDAGWLHPLADLGDRRPVPVGRRRVVITPPSRPDFTSLSEQYRAAADPAPAAEFADSLGLSVRALSALCVGWAVEYRAWSFPMVDPTTGHVVGIRLRRPGGFKFAVPGSKDGLFLPETDGPADGRLLLTEGPTDAAALIDLGFPNVAGRPSCLGGLRPTVALIRLRRPAEVIVLADADEPGRRGAANLASVLVAYAPAVRVVVPPTGIKDVRDWKRSGVTRDDIVGLISAAPARRLTVRATAGKGGES